MGVPKFYRWMSERYPCLSEVVKDYQIPEFDNLYLDMNGVVHVCSHPDDGNPHFRITEEKIFADIFHYIEVLFRMIKPKKVFFMAIDGVAPRAKMNQQRGRRFRSAREAEDLVRKALEKGEILPTEERFDSNCITPGTEFMDKLHHQIKYFIAKKIATDRMWQGPRIYLSGHETPGEGEHKIMDFIRYEKCQSNYDPNTRHCLYGLDADLIMLGLASHEPHFSLLREEVRFGGKKDQQKRSTAPEETVFHLLHLSLFREYLDFEFQVLKTPGKLPFAYDIERIMDDWVLMGFLVGNDFIPHLPHMHIHSECLPLLWRVYMQVLPTLDGYLQDQGTINLRRLEIYLKVLSKNDLESFSDQYADIKWLEGKKAENEAKQNVQPKQNVQLMKRSATIGAEMSISPKEPSSTQDMKKSASIGSDLVGIPTANEFMVLKTSNVEGDDEDLMKAMGGMTLEEFEETLDEEEHVDWDNLENDELFNMEFRHHKNAYYMDKMEYKKVTPDVLREQATCYVRALQWILWYYYRGCQSWSWYYPHHYAPYLSDVTGFADMKMEFEMSTPFLPFQQLMSVLPAASKNLIPKPLQFLMLNDLSPVLDYYPTDFSTDLNGKLQDWEAVVLIPFINEKRLLSAMRPIEEHLTDEEKARNKHGPHICGVFDPELSYTYTSPLADASSFPDVVNCSARMREDHQDIFRIPPEQIKWGLCEGVRLETYFPGFPTLKHLKHTANLAKEGVKVFQMNSRGENMILELDWSEEGPDIEQVANEYIGQSVFVQWPHLQEVRVVSVSDQDVNYSIIEPHSKTGHRTNSHHEKKVDIHREFLAKDEVALWHRRVGDIVERYHDRKGVDIGQTYILLEGCVMTGRKYMCGHHGNITLEKQWSSRPTPFAFQTSVKDIAVQDHSFKQYKTLDELFIPKSQVFMLGTPHYGCMGDVMDIDPKNDGRIRVEFHVPVEPDLGGHVLHKVKSSQHYMVGYQLANRLGITSHLVSRITGAMMVGLGSKANPKGNNANRLNVGLNLKFNKSGREVPGYSMKNPADNQWRYSEKTLRVLEDYIEKFPELFDYVSKDTNEDTYYEEDIFTENIGEKMKELKEYLKELDCKNVAPAAFGSKTLDDEVVNVIEQATDRLKDNNQRKKRRVKMQVRPHLLHRSLDAQAQLIADPSTETHIFDRIVNIRDGYSVPLGLRGTVIGILSAEKEQDIIYEAVFDECFLGGMTLRCSPGRGYRVPATSFLNITHGERKEKGKSDPQFKPTAVVHPQNRDNRRYQEQKLPYAAVAGPSHQPTGAYSQLRQGQRGMHQNHDERSRRYQDENWRGHRGSEDRRGHHRGSADNSRNTYNQDRRSHGQSANHQTHGQSASHQTQIHQNDGNQDEFAALWNTLQKSSNAVMEKAKQSQNPGQSSGGGSSLQDAAVALQSSKIIKSKEDHSSKKSHSVNTKSGTNLNQNSNIQQQDPTNKIDLDYLFSSMGGQQQLSSQPVSASSLIDSTQPSYMRDTLELSGPVSGGKLPLHNDNMDSGQAGTAALHEMLNIGVESKNTEQSRTNKPNYGKQLSVQELFEEVTHKQEEIKQLKENEKNFSQKQKMRHKGVKRNAMTDLYNHCQSLGLPPPRYNFQPGRDGKVVAFVEVGCKTYKGSYTRDQYQASESAAGIAMLNLQQPPQNHGQFASSPNSAFRPVGKMPIQAGASPGAYRHAPQPGAPFFRPNTAQPAGQPQWFQGQSIQQEKQTPPNQWYQGANLQLGWNQQQQQQREPQWYQGANFQQASDNHGPNNKGGRKAKKEINQKFSSESHIEEQAPKTPSKTAIAFMPTQVQLKQKTPQRELYPKDTDAHVELTSAQKKLFESLSLGNTIGQEKSDEDKDVQSLKLKEKASKKGGGKKTVSRGGGNIAEGGQDASAKEDKFDNKHAIDSKQHDKKDVAGRKKQQPKRPKSRIAANFPGVKK